MFGTMPRDNLFALYYLYMVRCNLTVYQKRSRSKQRFELTLASLAFPLSLASLYKGRRIHAFRLFSPNIVHPWLFDRQSPRYWNVR